MTDLATIIRGIRSDLGIGRLDFGELLRESTGASIGLSQISRWEAGKRAPSGEVVLAILALSPRLAAAMSEVSKHDPGKDGGITVATARRLLGPDKKDGISRQRFYQLVEAGAIRRVTMNGRVALYSRGDIERLLAQRAP
jgi:hypothetical protein